MFSVLFQDTVGCVCIKSEYTKLNMLGYQAFHAFVLKISEVEASR